MENAFSIDTALTTGTQLMEWVLDTIAGNPILTTCLVVGLLIPVGVSVFNHFKHAVR